MNSEASNTRVIEARPIKKEDFLIRIGGSSNKIFENEETRVVEHMFKFQRVDRRVTLKIRDPV